MKKHKYIRDIEDTFEEGQDLKKAQFFAKKIKSVQKKSFPSIEFKQHLSDRLHNIYELSLLDDESSRFSIFQLWSIGVCFMFVCVWVIWIFGIQSKPLPEWVQHANPASSSIVAPEAMMLDAQEEIGIMWTSSIESWDFQKIPTDLQGLCEYYGGSYRPDESCEFANGTICLDYNEQSIQGCMLNDANSEK